MNYYLAVDIGASSGRHILAHMENGKIVLEEIYRFENGMITEQDHLVWNIQKLFDEILAGMKKCCEIGKIPYSMGIDTWAVDYALLDDEGKQVGPVYGYRDKRTQGIDKDVYEIISEEVLYARTGIQKQPFNTIYQLMAVLKKEPELLERANTMLLVPDYLNYMLTGQMATEYTNATTTQLVNPNTNDWDWALIERLGYSKTLFREIRLPGTDLGELRDDIAKQVGFSCHVIMPATHDTASAVMAVPEVDEDVLYISSGTWSLMGTELLQANCSPCSRSKNLTNEGGYDYRYRYLKNIMGLWMINSVRKELAPNMPFSYICEQAAKENIASLVDVNDVRFMAPESMAKEVIAACQEAEMETPRGIFQIAAVIYNSLAKCYANTVREIEEITQKQFACIHVVGGGANAEYLNKLTARACGKPVIAGPIEATALGNIAAQMIANKELRDLQEARKCIGKSFLLVTYKENE